MKDAGSFHADCRWPVIVMSLRLPGQDLTLYRH